MRTLFLPFLLLFYIQSFSQAKPLIYQQQSWASYSLQVKVGNHWGGWFDTEIHTAENYFAGFSQASFRLGGTYFNRKGNKFSIGYGYSEFFPGENHKFVNLYEQFGWQQYQWLRNQPKNKLSQWLRLEERWRRNALDDYQIADSYTNTYRLRYNVSYQVSLSKKGFRPGGLSLAMSNEIYLYYGPRINNHLFDQDRAFLGFNYSLNSHNNLQFGILNIIQEDLTGTQFKDYNVFRFSLQQNFGLPQHTDQHQSHFAQ